MGYVYTDTHTGKLYCAFKDETGRLVRRFTEAPNKALARQVLARFERDVLEKRLAGVKSYPDLTFRQFAARYLRHSRAHNARSTADRDRTVIDKLLAVMGNKKLLQIRRRDAQEYLDKVGSTVYTHKDGSKKHIAPATVDRERIALMAVFSFAVANEYIPKDEHPVKGTKIKKGEKQKMRELMPDEEAALMAILRDPAHPRLSYLENIIRLDLASGLRENELLSLKWAHVDLTIRDADGEQTWGRLTVESANSNPTKGKRTRYVPLTQEMNGMLSGMKQEALREAQGTEAAIRDRYLFVNPQTGTRWVDTKTAWTAARRMAGIEDVRFHDLRHTFATRFYRRTHDLAALQRILGHRSIELTLRYAHVTGEDMAKAMNRMSAPKRSVAAAV